MPLNANRRWGKPHPTFLAAFLILVALTAVPAVGRTLVEWDFSKGTHGWVGNNKVEALTSSGEGLTVTCTGEDPWIEGPAVDLPGEAMTRVKIRMKSSFPSASSSTRIGKRPWSSGTKSEGFAT